MASGWSLRAAMPNFSRENFSNGRLRYSPRIQRNCRGTFAGVFPSCGTSPRKTSLSITSCFKNACPTSCFGTRSIFSPTRCDPISNPSAVSAQTVVHPSALPNPRSPRNTAACPPTFAANCLNLVDDLALLLPGNINLSTCSLVRYRHTAKNPHNSLSLSVNCRFRPASLNTANCSITSPHRKSHFPATQSSGWEWVAGKGRRPLNDDPDARRAERQVLDSAGRKRQQPRNSPRKPHRATDSKPLDPSTDRASLRAWFRALRPSPPCN